MDLEYDECRQPYAHDGRCSWGFALLAWPSSARDAIVRWEKKRRKGTRGGAHLQRRGSDSPGIRQPAAGSWSASWLVRSGAAPSWSGEQGGCRCRCRERCGRRHSSAWARPSGGDAAISGGGGADEQTWAAQESGDAPRGGGAATLQGAEQEHTRSYFG